MLYYISFEIIIIFLILSLILISVLFESKIKDLGMFVSYPVAISIVTLVFSSCVLFFQMPVLRDFKILLFFDQYIIDFYSGFAKFFLLFGLICILIFLQAYLLRYKQFFNEYLILVLFAFLGMVIMVSAYDFLILYLAIELLALSSYALAALRTDSRISIEAGLKYFITGTVASIFFLLGVALVYLSTGTTNFNALSLYFIMVDSAAADPILFYGIFFITVGLLAKLGAAPFHMWLLDVYQGSPLVVTAFFSILPKIALIFLLIRLYYEVLGSSFIEIYVSADYFKVFILNYFFFENNLSLLYMTALFSICIGAIGGLVQINIKRLFAYSSINNLGFILLALSLGTVESLHSALFYFLVYIFLVINFFALFITVRLFNKKPIVTILDLTGIDSLYALLLTLNLFSLAGVPPLAGFFSKLYIYFTLIEFGYTYTAILVVILSILSAFFYIRLISNLFFRGLKLEFWNLFFVNFKDLLTVAPMLLEIITLTTFFNVFFFFFVDKISNILFNLIFYLI